MSNASQFQWLIVWLGRRSSGLLDAVVLPGVVLSLQVVEEFGEGAMQVNA